MREKAGQNCILICWLCLLLCLCPLVSEAAAWDGDWYYREGSSVLRDGEEEPDEWKTFTYPGRPPLPASAHAVVLSKMLLPQDQQVNTLLFSTSGQSLRIWLGNHVIYSYGAFSQNELVKGTHWHMVQLPVISEPTPLNFELHSDSSSQLGYIDGLLLDTEMGAMKRLYLYDLTFMWSFPVAILFLLVMGIYHHFAPPERKRLYRNVLAFLLVFAIWLLCSSKINLMLWDQPVFWWSLMSVTAYLLPLSANFVLYEILRKEKYAHMEWVICANFCLFVLAIGGEVAGHHMLAGMMDAFYLVLGLGQGIAVCWLVEAAYSGNELARAALVPTVGFTVLGLIDGVSGHFRLVQWYTFVTPLGIYPFAYLISAMMRLQLLQEHSLERRAADLEYKAALAMEKSERDALTGCYNRHYLQAYLRDKAIKEPFSVLLLDIDHFKRVNDACGHDRGDQILKGFTEVLKRELDKDKHLVRTGGEEFLLLCPGLDMRMACLLGEVLRQAVASRKIAGLSITCSIGAACWHGEGDSAEAMFKRADQALYAAKNSGRNKLVAESAE